MYVIVDANGVVLGISTDPRAGGDGAMALPMPDGFVLDEAWQWRLVDGKLVRDEAAALQAAREQRIREIRADAARAIAALAWRVERAQERERLGLPGERLEDVLLEREAIRRASNRCEAEINACLNIEAVRAVCLTVTEADRPKPQRLTRLQFLRRFSDDEIATIMAAAETSPQLKAAILKWQSSEGIVLSDPATIAGVQALEIAGLIGPGRAAEILSLHQGD